MGAKKKDGDLVHRVAVSKNQMSSIGIATCGARRDQGAKVTTNSKQVNCPICRQTITEQRAAAKARFEALEIG